MKDKVLDNLWTDWAELIVELDQMEGADERKHKFCRIYEFSDFVIGSLWKLMNEAQREYFTKFLKDARWAEIVRHLFIFNNFCKNLFSI